VPLSETFAKEEPGELTSNDTLRMSPSITQTEVAPRKGAVRTMIAADVPAVARLFLKIFRGVDRPSGLDLREYLRTLTLESLSYSKTIGTRVYEHHDGTIPSALLTLPMCFVVCGNVVPGRLLGVFMTDANEGAVGAAQPVLALRPKRNDFGICDSASPTSCRHLLAIGGKPINVQNLEWSRSFRPLGALAGRLAERFFRRRNYGFTALTRPIDAMLRLMADEAHVEDPGAPAVTEMSVPAFLKHAPRLIAHYAVRPLWSEDELSWLVSMAAQNTELGAFTIRAVVDRAGMVIGSFVYYATPRIARVLNILSLPDREVAVLDAMFRHLDRAGHAEARGRAQPALMMGLTLQGRLLFRHKAFAMVLTRIPDVSEAVARGDIYIGGLAGEDWSRLMSDFH
jgi:hypothetical protein